MISRVTGKIESKNFSFEPLEDLENGRKLFRMSANDLFHGDLEAEARGEFVAMLRSDKSSEFIGMYRVSGNLEGRDGKFLLSVNGSGDSSGLSQGKWQVVSDSGVLKLAGLKGTGEFRFQSGGESFFSLNYELAA